MKAIVLLDTTVYLNILNVPGRRQNRDAVFTAFAQKIQEDDIFLLPLATVIEAGNHIARLSNGSERYEYAEKLSQDVALAIQGETPYRPMHFPAQEEFKKWLNDFPRHLNQFVGQETGDRSGFSDFSIFKEWEQTCARHSMSRVLIWSLDDHLKSYDRVP